MITHTMKQTDSFKRIAGKAILIVFFAVMLFGFANAKILVNVSSDKQTLFLDEVCYVTISAYNDSEQEVTDLVIKADGGEQIIFIEETDKATLLKRIELLPSKETREIKVKTKLISIKKNQAPIFVYYGNDKALPFAAATYVEAKANPITIKTSSNKTRTNEGDLVTINLKIENYTKQEIRNVAAEIKAPDNYKIKTTVQLKEALKENEAFDAKLEVLAPLNAAGEQKIILSYGYIDVNAPHYFEKNFFVTFENDNKIYLLAIGIIVLIVAVYIYIAKTKKSPATEIKGTGEKK